MIILTKGIAFSICAGRVPRLKSTIMPMITQTKETALSNFVLVCLR